MKYVLPAILAGISLVLIVLVATCCILTITVNFYYIFVALGIAFPALVAIAATSAAFDAVKDW